MPITFKPKSEDELSNFEPLPSGTYPFTVLESEEVASKSVKNAGRLMVRVKLNVHGPNSDRHVYDYFADWFSEWKFKHFCETAGLSAEYESGNVDASQNAWQDRTGSVTVKVQPASVKDGKNYAAKNEVEDYVSTKSAKPEAADLADDEIPF